MQQNKNIENSLMSIHTSLKEINQSMKELIVLEKLKLGVITIDEFNKAMAKIEQSPHT